MDKKVYEYMDWPRIEAIVYSEEASPKDVMMPRITPEGILIQGFFPEAEKAEVLSARKKYEMEQQDEAGYFAVLIPGRKIPKYRFRVFKNGKKEEFYDPYAFPGRITEEEEKAFCVGVYYHAYEKLGAHPAVIGGVKGTSFAVWAPNAVRVSVVGPFNEWDGRRLPMHRMPMSGIFELFVPGLGEGDVYKYEIKTKNGSLLLKADPYAFCTEMTPAASSVISGCGKFAWKDAAWMRARKKYAGRKLPISIYEANILDWETPEQLISFVSEMGYTHVELMPVMEYIDETSNGYSTSAYYAVTGRFGTTERFQKLVDGLHRAGVGVILDWTPAQFPRYAGGLEAFDGTPLYEPADPSAAVHPFWNTMLYNYASPMVKDFLIANAFYWLEYCHADGLRMDDVDAMLYLDYGRKPGQWKPNIYGTNENLQAIEFIKHLNSVIKKMIPGALLIAQEDGLWPELTDSVENDHLGFDYKWSGGWTKDLLEYLTCEPEQRKDHHDQLTLSMLYAYSEHYILTLGRRDIGSLEKFVESMPGDTEQKLSQARAALAYMTLHPGCKMMSLALDMPEGFKKCIRDLNAMYRTSPALYLKDDEYDGFEWVQLMKYEENVLAFLRLTDKPGETLLAVCNFSGAACENYQVGVPFSGKYKEIFNSDRIEYGGSGKVNPRVRSAREAECDERAWSVRMRLPAFGVTVFSCTPGK